MMPPHLLRFGLWALHTTALVSAAPSFPLRRSPADYAVSVPLDLSAVLNNKAFGTYAGEAAFDPLNQSFPAPNFDTTDFVSPDTGIAYSFPGYTGPGVADNLICARQTISVVPSRYFSVSFLVAADVESTTVTDNVTFTFSDNSTTQYQLRSLNYYNFLAINRGVIIFPSRFTSNSTNYNTSHIFERTAALPSHKELTSITLPSTTNTTSGRLHIFAVSLLKASGVVVQDVRPTQKWLASGSQIVEVTVVNGGDACVAGGGLTAAIKAAGFTTVESGHVKRLCPGDQKTVQVGVGQQKERLSSGPATCNIEVSLINNDNGRSETQTFPGVEFGLLPAWTEDLSTLAKHESPDWFNDAKFGIFIHWGPYSVTGWGNSSPYESYAEWFWWYSTHHPQADRSDFYDYRLRTFGSEWVYDDTFSNFTAAKFDAKAWVDLFAGAGAKYFVLTTKHHDGFALFDTATTSNRSSLHYGPKRDLLLELFDAAEKYQPELKRGTYFSLPEWFNPDFGPYGFDQFSTASTVSWPGIEAKNPYTNKTEPYTGHVPIGDFISDLMVPQMSLLAYNYNTDLMWCDCGAANGTAGFAADWWNHARTQNRQVAINSRCGLAETSDFDTPEYQTFSVAQRTKWESNQGIDPYSYGYNRATAPAAYMTASKIVYTLVDMVSKNGNLLLDIGPKPDGTIDDTEVAHLLDAGNWIHAHAEAIYNTTYWFVQSELLSGPDVRFTQTNDAFFILFLETPVPDFDGFVSIEAPIPILEGDVITLLGVSDTALQWTYASTSAAGSTLRISVSNDVLAMETYCWVFKVLYS
ncbi:alpha-l-fucosidase [Grosmannia clavigera kw1407]|uniref:alpha-L-fucosidase n=1 Tax=Grosmannia clavigera (strain kw1407 / UAMH 11150) TaxID=655863 RepID=F0XS46_GROCL|nr:alpha-l-fucosidase [Grosmannia clavigera kw1407]EFW99648.1 alpha-l-fucosidase [Grosmannia clavigera kw1407]